jgi:hypothetical protein
VNPFADSYRRLAALTMIASGGCVNQRALASRLSVSLGLANGLLRRLLSQRLVSANDPGGGRYAVTYKGRAEMAKLSLACASEADMLLGGFRDELHRMAARLKAAGRRTLLLCGDGPLAELAAGALRHNGARVAGVVAESPGPLPIAGLRVRKIEDAARIKHDACVAMTAADARALRRVLGRRARIEQAIPGK